MEFDGGRVPVFDNGFTHIYGIHLTILMIVLLNSTQGRGVRIFGNWVTLNQMEKMA